MKSMKLAVFLLFVSLLSLGANNVHAGIVKVADAAPVTNDKVDTDDQSPPPTDDAGDQASTNNDQASTNNDQASTNNDQASTNNDQASTNNDQASTNDEVVSNDEDEDMVGATSSDGGDVASLAYRAKSKVSALFTNLDGQLKNKITDDAYYAYFSDLSDEYLAMEYISAWVLGNNYRKMNPDQIKEYMKVVREYIVYSYGSLLRKYYQGYTFQVLDVVQKSSNNYEVQVKITPKDKVNSSESITSSWVLSYSKQRDQFYIVEIKFNNISLLQTQRASFSEDIKKSENDYDKFIDGLTKKVDEMKSGNKSTSQ